jgi:hypothetical protein
MLKAVVCVNAVSVEMAERTHDEVKWKWKEKRE